MINRVVLVGRMTKDADLKFTPNGNAVATFTLAVNRSFNKEETDFINCVVWKKPAENLANFTKKGSLIGLEGRIQVRTYDHETKGKQYITEVVADSVQFLDSKPKNEGQGVNAQQTKTQDNNPFEGSKHVAIDDQDLPF
jgi:single-strand DNA-binding protein